MSRATALIARLDTVLDKLNLTNRSVYKRTVQRSGGDQLIGRPANMVRVDTLLTPQPSISILGGYASQVVVGGVLGQLGDYICTVSPTAISTNELKDKDLLFVFKSGTAEEEFFLVSYNPTILNGIDVVYECLLRTKRRTT